MKRKHHITWLAGCLLLISLGSRWYSSEESSFSSAEPDSSPSPAHGLSLTYETFDEIRKLNPLTAEGLLLESTAPGSYDTWEQSGEALLERVENGTGLVGDFNNDGHPDRALPLVQDGVVCLVVASFDENRWYLPGHCFTELDISDVVNPRTLRELAIDACVIEENEEYAFIWRFWDRKFRAGNREYEAGRFEKALELFASSLEEARKIEHPDWKVHASQSLHGVAEVHSKLSMPKECLQYYRQAVQLLEADGEPEVYSVDLELAYRKLASELRRQRKTDESVNAYMRALDLHADNRCGSSPDVTKVELLLEISKAYSNSNQTKQAILYLDKAEVAYRTAYFAPGRHRHVPTYALKLGQEYRRLGEIEKAVELCEYGLEAWSRLQGAPPEYRDELQAELETLRQLQARP